MAMVIPILGRNQTHPLSFLREQGRTGCGEGGPKNLRDDGSAHRVLAEILPEFTLEREGLPAAVPHPPSLVRMRGAPTFFIDPDVGNELLRQPPIHPAGNPPKRDK